MQQLSLEALRNFLDRLNRFEGSFLKTDSWATVQKKIERSKRCWGES